MTLGVYTTGGSMTRSLKEHGWTSIGGGVYKIRDEFLQEQKKAFYEDRDRY